MKHLTIGQLARSASVNVETVRYYERRGLMPAPERRESGYRAYRPEDLERMNFIRRAKQLGFTLREIQDLLMLRGEAENRCCKVRERVGQKIEDIDRKIRDLEQMRQMLGALSASCVEAMSVQECPLLEALARSVGDPVSSRTGPCSQ